MVHLDHRLVPAAAPGGAGRPPPPSQHARRGPGHGRLQRGPAAPDAEQLYRDDLLPHAAAVTPNVHEAAVLLDRRITTLDEQRRAARDLGAMCPGVVVVKGGHAVEGSAQEAVDVIWGGARTSEVR